jgi:hypothetical protein
VALGELRPAKGVKKAELAGTITLAPPSATSDLWTRRFPDPSPPLPRGGCGCVPAHGSVASSCRW